jgi:hypothetical protein
MVAVTPLGAMVLRCFARRIDVNLLGGASEADTWPPLFGE